MITDAPSLTHRPMKNKAGTAAGNPRARADRASPTMNGNPNAQVCPICFHIHIHRGRRTCFRPFQLYHLLFSAHHFSFFQQVPSFLHGCTSCVFFCTSWFRALVLVPGAGGLSAKFWVLALRPGPWPLPQVQLQWQAPQWLIRHCRPPFL